MAREFPERSSFARGRQSEIFLGGVAGSRPVVPVDHKKLKEKARHIMSREAFAYVAGGAGAEQTMRANREAFRRWQLRPAMLRNASHVDTSVRLFGKVYPAPFLLAPIGVLEMAHQRADRAVAEAAAAEGIPFVFSSQASVPMEACAAAMGSAPRWFQLYWSTNNEVVRSFVSRAQACGCEAIVLTVDTTMLGWRPRDLDLAYLPFLRAKGIAQYSSDPAFKAMLAREDHTGADNSRSALTLASLRTLFHMCRAYPGSFLKNLFSGEPRRAVQTFIRTYSRPSLTWDDLSFLRSLTELPILLKGITHPEDAKRAVDSGMNGIIVSNHGGRQVDNALAALDSLPSVVNAVPPDVPVLFDSGIRSGADMVTALALGARAVLLGRPYVYALAAGGSAGVRETIRNYRASIELTMGLCGARSVDELQIQRVPQAEWQGR